MNEFSEELKKVNEKGVAHEAVVYLDNATIINACSLLSDQQTFDPYKLLDLESFCEAFLLYDRVHTLVGYSFMSAIRYGHRDSSTGSDFDTRSLYSELINKKLLVPITIGAGSFHYHIDNIEILDEVASSIDVNQTIEQVKSIFGDDIPWSRPAKSDWPHKTPADEAWNNLVIGEETWVSDSYPIYYFPIPGEKEPNIDGKLEVKRRGNSWVDVFVSQTFFYVVGAALLKRPYLCSSIRVPIVHNMVSQLNKQFFSVVHGSLGAISQESKKKIEAVIEFFGEGAIDFLFLPVLLCVLKNAKSRENIIDTLFQMREREDIKKFRSWCRALNQAWQDQDVDRIYTAIQELRGTSEQIAQALSTQPLPGTISHLPDINLITDKGRKRIASSEGALVSACFNPSLSFIKDVGVYLSSVGKNREMIEDILEYKLKPHDLSTLNQLQAHREQLYSKGKIVQEHQAVRVERVEITMGDKFDNIHNATIVNRSIVQNAFNRIKDQYDEETADALNRVADIVEQSGNREAAENFNSFSEELQKPEPKKSVLRSLWSGLTLALPHILQMSDIVTKISELFTG